MPFDKNKDEVFRILGIVGSFGFTMAGAVAGGYFLGSYLDKNLIPPHGSCCLSLC